MEVGETDPAAEGQGLLEVVVRLARKADDHVGGDGRAGKGVADALDGGDVVRRPVAASHSSQDAIAAALQGHVEVATQARVVLPEAEEVAGYLLGLERGDPEARNVNRLQYLVEERGQGGAGEVEAVAAELGAREDDLPVALVNALPHVTHEVRGRDAALAGLGRGGRCSTRRPGCIPPGS